MILSNSSFDRPICPICRLAVRDTPTNAALQVSLFLSLFEQGLHHTQPAEGLEAKSGIHREYSRSSRPYYW